MIQNGAKQQKTKVFLKNIYPKIRQKVEKNSKNYQWGLFCLSFI